MKKPYALYLITILLLFSCKEDDVLTKPSPESIQSEIFMKVNDYRKSIGMNELIENELCTELALGHSQNMATGKIELSHDGFLERFQLANEVLGALAAGENVANNFPTGSDVVDAWLASPSHKENLEGQYTHVGIGVAEDEDGQLYMTQFLVRI